MWHCAIEVVPEHLVQYNTHYVFNSESYMRSHKSVVAYLEIGRPVFVSFEIITLNWTRDFKRVLCVRRN